VLRSEGKGERLRCEEEEDAAGVESMMKLVSVSMLLSRVVWWWVW